MKLSKCCSHNTHTLHTKSIQLKKMRCKYYLECKYFLIRIKKFFAPDQNIFALNQKILNKFLKAFIKS